MATQQPQPERAVHDMVYIALNRRVIALDRYSGETVWVWRAPYTCKFVSLLLDGDRLIVSCNGYIYCLDPLFGQEAWNNPLTGFGTGIASLASIHGSTSSGGAAATIAAQQQAAAAAAASSAPVG